MLNISSSQESIFSNSVPVIPSHLLNSQAIKDLNSNNSGPLNYPTVKKNDEEAISEINTPHICYNCGHYKNMRKRCVLNAAYPYEHSSVQCIYEERDISVSPIYHSYCPCPACTLVAKNINYVVTSPEKVKPSKLKRKRDANLRK